mgnify:CR=1 FL=1
MRASRPARCQNDAVADKTQKTRYVDNGWPTRDPEDHPVSELAADRVGVECMGIDPAWVGYLGYCERTGVGRYDLARIDVRGEKTADVKRPYQLHQDIQRMLEWMGPMKDLPPKLG